MGSVSVVMPVYNAVPYLVMAVESVLDQSKVKELLLIEDNSQDNSLEICEALCSRYERIRLLRHEGGINLGPGESRNVGLKNASGEYIAFLDADDLYLPDRFKKCLSIMQSDHLVDGVYEVIGAKNYDSKSWHKHIERMKLAKKNIVEPIIDVENTGIEGQINSDDLFLHLLKCDKGWIHLNGLTLRRSSLGNFDLFTKKYIGEDSEFITRLAFERNLTGTKEVDPVALRGVHRGNRILDSVLVKQEKEPLDWNYWLEYSIKQKIGRPSLLFVILRVADSPNKLIKLFKIGYIFLKKPYLLWSFLLI